jgi:hypothetical protein
LADHGCFGPAEPSLGGLIRVAGTRRAIQDGHQQAKGDAGDANGQVAVLVSAYVPLILICWLVSMPTGSQSSPPSKSWHCRRLAVTRAEPPWKGAFPAPTGG